MRKLGSSLRVKSQTRDNGVMRYGGRNQGRKTGDLKAIFVLDNQRDGFGEFFVK